MKTEEKQVISYPQALDIFFGGIHEIAKSSLPIKCKCGKDYYERNKTDYLGIKTPLKIFLLNQTDLWMHVRRHHKEFKLSTVHEERP